MRRPAVIQLLALIVPITGALSAAGCGGSASKMGPQSSTGPVVFEAFPVAVAEVLCGKIFGCCSTMQRRGTETLVGADEAECRALVTATLSQSLPAIQQSIARGRLGFDGATLRSCVTKGTALSCPDLERTGSPLEDCMYLVPKVATGGVCENDAECIAGYCDGLSAVGPGRCAALKAMNATCTTDSECASSWCDLDATSTCTPSPGMVSFCG